MSSPPTTLGQYQIIREIARSNDIVYEAYDPLMNRRVAVKELMMPGGSTQQQREDRVSRFKREAQAAGTLNHPNIMTVYSFAEDGDRTFMAMEYLDGQTLRNEIDTKGNLPMDRAVEIASAVLSGLEHAHSKGVIHRDIKPDNIQILSNGNIKITDFGIARLTFQPNLTVDGQVFGTPSYMSPEQVVGKEIDARSDLFSVGVMLYEMLTGKKPFSGDSVVSTTYAIMNKEPDDRPNLSWPLWSVIERALSKSPTMRYSGASEMQKALNDALSPGAGVLPTIDPNTPAGYLTASNPYAQPPPAPAGAYGYGTPTPPPPQIPITAPYNPYVTPNAAANPYATQYQQQQQPATPITYPYSPYASGGGALPPHTPGPGMSAPIYYPPPPRQPLFKPETTLFVKKLILGLMIFGTLLALLMVSIQALFQFVNEAGARHAKTDVATQIRQAKQDGQADPAIGENDYLDDQKDHPHDPALSSSQGDMYFRKAADNPYPDGKADLYWRSALAFEEAVKDESDKAKKLQYEQSFIDAALQAGANAQGLSDYAHTQEIRDTLQRCRLYALSDASLLNAIDNAISRLHL